MWSATHRIVLLLLVAPVAFAAGHPEAARNTVAGSPGSSIHTRLDQAKALLDRRANTEALKILQELRPTAESSRDGAFLLEVVYQTARAHFQLTDFRAARPALERALALSRAQKNRAFEAEVLRATGSLHKSEGLYPLAVRTCHEAVKVYEELGDERGAGRAWMIIGAAYDLSGEFQQALEAYEQARVRLEKIRDTQFFTLLNEVAITYTNLGRYDEALAALAISLEGRERLRDPYLIGISHGNIGEVYFSLGQFDRAIPHYEQCLDFCRQANERRCQAIAFGELAQAWMGVGDYRKALSYAQQEVQATRDIGTRHLEGAALGHVAETYAHLGDWQQSRRNYEQALDLARGAGALQDEGKILAELAGIHLQLNQPGRARPLAEQALEAAGKTSSPELQSRAHAAFAHVARAAKDNASALTHLRASVALIDSVRGRVLTDSGKIGYLDIRQSVFHDLADVLREQGREADALEVAEAARGRAFNDLLAARQLALQPKAADSLSAIRAAEARLRAQEEARPTESAAVAQLASVRAATEVELAGKLRALHEEEPELASLVATQTLGFREIAALAARLDATLIEYLVTGKRLLIWVVSPRGTVVSAAVDIDRDVLREKVRALHERLNGFDSDELRQPARVRQQLADLYRLLLAPVARQLPRDSGALVYVVPHDALLLVPFAALVDEKGRYLVQTHTLASAPSLGVLRYTAAKKKRVVSPRQPHLLALADPRPPDDAGLEPLPGAREEVRQLSRRFPADHRVALVGDQATEANARRLGPGQTVLHFAVHGLARDDRPWESALLLTPGNGEDGWLKVSEIFGMDLRADLVVLSGCSTGLGKLTGDGMVGLARALIYAGTPSVLVSQWDVSDLATAYLMDRFYSGFVAGHGKARALRTAQLAALERFGHPALWSPFVLIGEPQ